MARAGLQTAVRDTVSAGLKLYKYWISMLLAEACIIVIY